MRPLLLVCSLAFVGALLGHAAFAQQSPAPRAPVYRWVDAQGHTRYGDVTAAPPGATPLHRRALAPARPATPASTPAAPAEPSLDPTPPDAQDELAQVRKSCQAARRNEQLLADPGRQVLDDGGAAVMTPEARAQRLALVRRQVQAYCDVLGTDAPGVDG